MGSRFRFFCSKCGYDAEASGGRDCGMVAVVETRICSRCRIIVDVVIGAFGQDGPSGDADLDKETDRCPECKTLQTTPWPASRPCPKCGETMNEGGMTALWD